MKRVLWILPLILLLTTGGVAAVSNGGPAAIGGSDVVAAQDQRQNNQQDYRQNNQQDYRQNNQQDYRQGNNQGYGSDLDINYEYDYLSSYGDWVNMDPYGYVWVPRHMGYRWRPYSDGHWVYTDYGWTWIDNSEWGWIPFHYGRWGMDNDIGWYWVPGTTWGPAWVTWRSNDMYMGWAPLPPDVDLRAGMDFASLRIDIPGSFWIFVSGSHFMDPDIHSYVLPYERNVTIVNNTTIYNNFGFRGDRFVNDGVGMDRVRHFTGRDAPRYTIQDARQPGQYRVSGNDVQVYRPAFRADANARPKSFIDRNRAQQELAPAKVFEPPRQPLNTPPTTYVRQRQTQERKLLQTTQAQELRAIDQQRNDQLKATRASAEKARVQQDYQMKKSALAQQHQVERQQMDQRHRTDAQQVRQATPAGKNAQSKKNKG